MVLRRVEADSGLLCLHLPVGRWIRLQQALEGSIPVVGQVPGLVAPAQEASNGAEMRPDRVVGTFVGVRPVRYRRGAEGSWSGRTDAPGDTKIEVP